MGVGIIRVLIIIDFLGKARCIVISWRVLVYACCESVCVMYPYSFSARPPPPHLHSRFLFPVLCSCSSGKTLWGFVYLFVLVLRRGRERKTAEVGRDSCRLPKREERDWLPFKNCRRICVVGNRFLIYFGFSVLAMELQFCCFFSKGLIKNERWKIFQFHVFVTGKNVFSKNCRTTQVKQRQVEPPWQENKSERINDNHTGIKRHLKERG